MADFFEDWKRRLTETAADLSEKVEDTIEIQKKKSNIRSLARSNSRDYMDIGKAIYDAYQKGEVIDGDLAALCESIEKREEKMKEIQAEIEKSREED